MRMLGLGNLVVRATRIQRICRPQPPKWKEGQGENSMLGHATRSEKVRSSYTPFGAAAQQRSNPYKARRFFCGLSSRAWAKYFRAVRTISALPPGAWTDGWVGTRWRDEPREVL